MHGLLPTHGTRDLLNQALAGLYARADLVRLPVIDKGPVGIVKCSGFELRGHIVLSGFHQRAVERRADCQRHRTARTCGFRELHRPAHRAGMSRDHHLVGSVQICGADNLTLRGFLQDLVEPAGGKL